MPADEIDLVLFDLGGVLIDPGGVGPIREMSGIDSDEELWRRWLTCRWVRAFEQGACSPEAFATGLVEDWGLALTPDEFLAEFTGWPHPVLDGAGALVEAVRQAGPIGCLSNTNAVQWEANCAQWPLLAQFEFCFLSFEMGMVKPDVEIFAAAAARLPVPADRVLFLDDNAMNIEAAVTAGYRAERTQGPAATRRALERYGVLTPS